MNPDPIEEMRLTIERSISRLNLLIQNNPRNEGSLFDRNIATIKNLDQIYIDTGSIEDNTGLGKIVNQHKSVQGDLRIEEELFTAAYQTVMRRLESANSVIKKDYFELSKPQTQVEVRYRETIPDHKLICNRYYKKILGRTLD